MPFYKLSFIFKLIDQGWTESYYVQEPTATAAINIDPLTMGKFIDFRAQQTVLQAVRAVEVGGVRRGVVLPVNRRGQSSGATPDITGATAQIAYSSPDGHNRKLWVRGLADADVVRAADGSSQPSAFLNAGLLRMIDQVTYKPFRIQFLTAQPKYSNLTLMPQTGNDAITTVNFPPAQTTPIPGEYVRFFGYDRCILHNFSAPFRVLAATAGQFSIPYKWRLKDASYAPANLQWAKVVYGYDPIATGGFVQFTTRKTGRPFGLSRGRIPARSCRR